MAQGQPIDQHVQRENAQPQAQQQPPHSSPNMLPPRSPHEAFPRMMPPMSRALSVPVPEQRLYGTPSNRRCLPPDHPFAAAVRDVPVFNLEAAGSRSRGNSNASTMQPQEEFNTQYPLPPPLHSDQVLWPNFPPRHPAMPPGQKYSRLPPNDVARKAPRKSAASNNEALRLDGRANPAQRRASKQEYRQRPDTPAQRERESHDGPPLTPGNALHGYHRSIQSLQTLQAARDASCKPSKAAPLPQQTTKTEANKSHARTPARGRRIILKDDDEYVDEDEAVPSIEVNPTTSPAPPAATARRTRRSQAGVDMQTPRPCSRYEHAVPKGLKSIQRAFGEDNWTEYLNLVEQKIQGYITEEMFSARSKAIFMVFNDEKKRARIEKRIEAEVVIPVIEQERERDERTATLD